MSCLIPEDSDEDPKYQPHLFLQGLVWTSRKVLPFTKLDLYQNKLPHTIIYLDDKHVMMLEPKVNVFIGKREDTLVNDKKVILKSGSEPANPKEFKEVDKESHTASPVIKEFLSNLWMLNTVGGQRETFIAGFLRLLKLKALALAKYLDTDISKPILEAAADMLAFRANQTPVEKTKINLSTLQQDLVIEAYGDLLVILAFTEKIRPRTYMDVLGDPQLENIAVIEEFASL